MKNIIWLPLLIKSITNHCTGRRKDAAREFRRLCLKLSNNVWAPVMKIHFLKYALGVIVLNIVSHMIISIFDTIMEKYSFMEAIMSVSLNYGHIIFYSCTNLLFFLIVSRYLKKKEKELQPEKKPESFAGGIRCEMCGTDENTKLVIKSIGAAKHGFKNFGGIVNETNLSLNVINHALDWLVMNKFATESDGRKGKVYELSQKGRNAFSSIINPPQKTT